MKTYIPPSDRSIEAG